MEHVIPVYYDEAVAITPSDTERFDSYDALCVSDAGTVKIQPAIGSPVTLTFQANFLPAVIPIKFVKVFATGTSATVILGLRKKRFVSPFDTGQQYSGDGP